MNEDRPFKDLTIYDLREIGFNAYDADDPVTLDRCIEEMTVHRSARISAVYRKELMELKNVFDTYSFLEPDKPHPGKEWVLQLLQTVGGHVPDSIGDDNIFIVCLYDPEDEVHGIYLGRTRMDVHTRYEQLRAGIDDGWRKVVMKQGIGLMEPIFTHLLNIGDLDADLIMEWMPRDLYGFVEVLETGD